MKVRKGRLNIIEIRNDTGSIYKIGIIKEKSRPYRLKVEAWVLSQLNSLGVNVPRVFGYYQDQEGREVLILQRIYGKRLSQIMSKKNAQVMLKVGTQLALLRSSMKSQGYGWIDPISMTGKFDDWRSFLLFYLQKYGDLLKNRGTLSEESLKKLLHLLDSINLEDVKPCLVHRDIKPSNILIDKNGEVWILDWENTIIGDQLFDLAIFGARFGEGEFWKNLAKGLELEFETSSPKYMLYKIIGLIGVIDFCQQYGLHWEGKQRRLHKLLQKLQTP